MTPTKSKTKRAKAAPPPPLKEEGESLKNQFLIAMPSLEDSNFNHTVSLMCEHHGEGAVGLVINRPTELKLTDMMKQMGLGTTLLDPDAHVFWGGPVQPERGFVVHRGPGGWESCLELSEGLFITSSRDILKAIGEGDGPKEYFVVLGCASWGEGQLEEEILHNSWLNSPLSAQILFQTPVRDRWKEATKLLGVDVTQLTAAAGHA